jgi:sirohydrochlorin cobaltochelatase
MGDPTHMMLSFYKFNFCKKMRAIVVENVCVRRERSVLFLPAGPAFRLEKEIKNVITVVAKTYHYWTEHLYS